MINKITIGFVIQQIDEKTGKCVRQDFIAGEQVDYEDEYGEPIDVPDNEIFHPFPMLQPGEK